ncbi:2-oxo acid dehydrogenase subunit E2 [Nonomuraea deserti]|uniref:Dihydrolipoamide acetyltransferase component of pyruvate dehydrogenase complex n=2 Tax=Nonomuraea deserti TaxID=1848322 RepID=A0A4R4UZ41_9ACTN|nr:2-oxo acid dehydrogenase subunit E2 [Nonomuraea deserti]
MPQLGETVAEGTVTRWLVDVGAQVTANEPLLEVSTDKVDTEIDAPADGVLRRILVPEGQTVPVGTVIALVGDMAASAGSGAPPASTLASRQAGPVHVAVRAPRHQDSPRVRRLAREHGVDLAQVRRSGPNGRATATDVRAAIRPAQPRDDVTRQPEPAAPRRAVPASAVSGTRGRVERLSRRRKVIAERMHRSLQESAQLTTVIEVDLNHAVKTREAAKDAFRSRYGVPLSVLPFVAEAAVQSLADHPVINAELDLAAGTVTYPAGVGLGIAVDTDEGLVVPVIRDADDLTVGALARHIAHLAARARDGSATADDFAGGTFTITNTGSRGALFDTPILNTPQSAILGLGAVTRRPVALRGLDGEDLIAVHPMAYMSLTYDHRLVDGADAARYLTSVKNRIESSDNAWEHSLGIVEIAR